MAEAGKDCGEDLNVNERTQTNVCTALRSPLKRGRRLMIMSVEEREKERKKERKARKGGERRRKVTTWWMRRSQGKLDTSRTDRVSG